MTIFSVVFVGIVQHKTM